MNPMPSHYRRIDLDFELLHSKYLLRTSNPTFQVFTLYLQSYIPGIYLVLTVLYIKYYIVLAVLHCRCLSITSNLTLHIITLYFHAFPLYFSPSFQVFTLYPAILLSWYLPCTCSPTLQIFTLYLQSSPPDRMRLLTGFQSTFRITPSCAFH